MKFSIHELTTHYTDTLSAYIKGLTYEDIPPEVIDRAKMIAMQTIGVAIAANGVPMSGRAIELGKRFNGGSGGEATCWIDGSKLSMSNAAFVNGALSDMLAWED